MTFADWTATLNAAFAEAQALADRLRNLPAPDASLADVPALLEWRQRMAGLYDAAVNAAESEAGMEQVLRPLKNVLQAGESRLRELLRTFEDSLSYAARQDTPGLICPALMPFGSVSVVRDPGGPREVRLALGGLPPEHWLRGLVPPEDRPGGDPGWLVLGAAVESWRAGEPVPLDFYSAEAVRRRSVARRREQDRAAEGRAAESAQMERRAEWDRQANLSPEERLHDLQERLARGEPVPPPLQRDGFASHLQKQHGHRHPGGQ